MTNVPKSGAPAARETLVGSNEKTPRPHASNSSDFLRFDIRFAIVQSATIAVCAVHPYAPAAIIAACGVAILVSPYRALQALALLAVVRYLNPTLVQEDSAVTVLNFLVFVAAGIRYGPSLIFQLPPTGVPLLCFVIFTLIAAPIASPLPTVSIMKVLYFAIGGFVLLSAAASISTEERARISVWYFNLVIVVVILSAPLVLIPDIGFLGNNGGFRGILQHSQGFGVFLSPLCSAIMIAFLFSSGRSLSLGTVLLALVLLIILSQTRTAALAVALSVVLVSLLLMFRRNRSGQRSHRPRAIIIGITLLLAAVGLTAIVPQVRDAVVDFTLKRGEGTVKEALVRGRMYGAAGQLDNFLASPAIGHGFGVSPFAEANTKVVKFYGIPISAPVEKGFLPTAILEEVGLIGAALFLWWLAAATRLVAKGQTGIFEALFAAALFVNAGEYIFFAMNSLGLLNLLLISLAIADGQTIQATKRTRPGRNSTVEQATSYPSFTESPHG